MTAAHTCSEKEGRASEALDCICINIHRRAGRPFQAVLGAVTTVGCHHSVMKAWFSLRPLSMTRKGSRTRPVSGAIIRPRSSRCWHCFLHVVAWKWRQWFLLNMPSFARKASGTQFVCHDQTPGHHDGPCPLQLPTAVASWAWHGMGYAEAFSKH